MYKLRIMWVLLEMFLKNDGGDVSNHVDCHTYNTASKLIDFNVSINTLSELNIL